METAGIEDISIPYLCIHLSAKSGISLKLKSNSGPSYQKDYH